MENTANNNQGVQLGRPGVYRLLHTDEEIKRQDRELKNLTFVGLHNLVSARAETLNPKTDSFEVNMQACMIKLNINECGGHRFDNAPYSPKQTYTANCVKTSEATTVDQVINKAMSSEFLVRFFKNIPHLFVGGEQACKDVLKALRNVNVEVANVLKQTGDDIGQRTKEFAAKFVDRPSETNFSMRYAIYQGEADQDIAFSLSFELNEAGNGVEVWVRNPMMPHTERDARKKMMDMAIKEIMAAAGKNCPPLVFVQS